MSQTPGLGEKATATGADGASAVAGTITPLHFKRPADEAVPGAGQWIGAVLVCTAVLAIALVWLRRRGLALGALRASGGGTRRLEVLERLALDPQTRLTVLRYEDRQLLIAHGPAGVSCVHDCAAASPDRNASSTSLAGG